MGYIKEPIDIDFFVDPKPLTEMDKIEISKIIAHYKSTGQKEKITSSMKDVISKTNTSLRGKI